MKIKFWILSVVMLVFVSCNDSKPANDQSPKENVTESKEVVPKVKNEVQVGDTKLVYKVSLGVLPDLAYKGVGMKAAKVHKDRPGYLGGMQDGDIVTQINGKEVKNLVEYTKLLTKYKKGDSVELTVKRDGATHKLKITFD